MIFKLSKSSKDTYTNTADAIANIGGFIIAIYLVFGVLIKPFNKKMYIKTVIEDSFLVKKTNSLMSVITPKTSK